MDKSTFSTTTFVKDMKVVSTGGQTYDVEAVFFNSFTFKVKSADGIDSYIKCKDVARVIYPYEDNEGNAQLEMYAKRYKDLQEKFNKRTAMNTRMSSVVGSINALVSKMDSTLSVQQNISHRLNQFKEQIDMINKDFYENEGNGTQATSNPC